MRQSIVIAAIVLCGVLNAGETATTLDDVLTAIQRLEAKVDDIQERIAALEGPGQNTPAPAGQPTSRRGPARQAKPKEGETDDRFPLTGVRIEKAFGSIYLVHGEITNNSGRDYDLALFKLAFYDANDKRMGTVDVAIRNFGDGETHPIDSSSNREMKGWTSYRIRMESGY